VSGAVIGGVVIGLLAIVGIGAGFAGMRQLNRGASRVLGLPLTEPVAFFAGAALSRTVAVGWPLASLELFRWGVRLSSARFLRFFPLSFPTWEARYEELAVVRHVTGPAGFGLRFAVTGSSDAVVFWSRRCSEILDRLQAAGAIVDRAVVSLKQAGGTYKT
jgi:hypothetical protein